MTSRALILQCLQCALVFAGAPLLAGWVEQCRAWFGNRHGAGPLQPYRVLRKLWRKELVVAHAASWVFRTAPYLLVAAMIIAGSIVPLLAPIVPLAPAADAIALVGVFAFARMVSALAAMDIGTGFGSMGARREMLIGFLAEPALLMVLFTPALISHSTSLAVIVRQLTTTRLFLYPSMAFAASAYVMVLLAENARIPVDNPDTHLELTMIHGALHLEYAGRHLALMEWAGAIKLATYMAIGIALFLPWGMSATGSASGIALATGLLAVKMTAAGTALAAIETLLAKLRLFRVPEFLGTAFMVAVLGILVHFLLGT
ncbi:MAG: NADH-quinone oxidoreductase subunit H [Gammaproteobacteria bacterium]|nr:NADH-quinone oxidoreductase subunit H [Gammaproteobacteria bacterium]